MTVRSTTPAPAAASPAAPHAESSPGEKCPNKPAADELRRRELGAFLRSRRERILPEQVGLPRGRRRTPGLRREEVAQLSGVGVTWYTWLEQGRDITVSDQVLGAIARTLMLEAYERSHLFALAGSAATQTIARECESVSPAMHAMLTQLDPYPAVVQNARTDLLVFNRTYGRLMCGLDAVPVEERNCLWLLFTFPAWRPLYPDWAHVTAQVVGQYRAAMADHMGERAWKSLPKRLREVSPEFAALWERHEVRSPENRTKQLLHPEVGLMNLDFTSLWFGPRLGHRMLTYTPADERSAEGLRALHQAALESA